MGREIVTAYRTLYKHILRAVQFSKPNRYTYRDRLREAFRHGDAASFDQVRIDNTVEFLKAAALDSGIEHKVVKNLAHVWNCQPMYMAHRNNGEPSEVAFKYRAFDHYNHTISMLNESLHMCIPISTHWQTYKKRRPLFEDEPSPYEQTSGKKMKRLLFKKFG